MSLECRECERDIRGDHDRACSLNQPTHAPTARGGRIEPICTYGPIARTPGTCLHLLAHAGWGNDFSIRPDEDPTTARLTVFRQGPIRVGDYLSVPDGDRKVLYRVTKVRTPHDPGDQHLIKAEHCRWADSPFRAPQ